MIKRITIFDKYWKLPILILIAGALVVLVVSFTVIGNIDGIVTPGLVWSSIEESVILKVIGLFIFIFFLSSWLISIPVSNKYQHLQSLLTNQQGTLKNLAHFAEKIGKGNYDENPDFSLDSELTQILITMRDRLKGNTEKDRNDKWISKGRDLIGGILRENKSIEEISLMVLNAIVDFTRVVQGALYLTEEVDNDIILKMKSCYAYSRRKHIEKEYKIGEGLVGQAAIEMDTIHRTEIPDSYISITSGLLGDQKPSALLIVPLITDEKLQGAIELASFNAFTELEIKFLEDLAVMIARTVFNLKTSERTEMLLMESREMTRELQDKQSQLEEHAVEMVQKQELIEETNVKLETQIQEVQNSQKRQHALLENASEIISIYNEDACVLYESPSVRNILGYTPEEMHNGYAFEKLDGESKRIFNGMFRKLKNDPDIPVNIEFTFRKKDGNTVWMEGEGRNMLNDPAINGIIFNHRDITERKVAEKEQIMRGKMQALSENSQDMILRFDLSGICQYANPVVERFIGISNSELIKQPFQTLDINQQFKVYWQETINEVENSGKIVEKEFYIEGEEEDRFILINAIPEYDSNKSLESVLLVSHDITERKKSEEIVKASNRKITESINYAKRIQQAIIPTFVEIKKCFKDALIWYQPKDVVSGDFPWAFRNGDDIYVAAVDCTGHGVPGAMMSLIGYLLMNDISKQKNITPASILSQLHKAVVKTLKQDIEGNNAADGMDVAIIRYNERKGFLEFSGAHRPLYHISHGELDQIKGDKFPIGGSHYNQEEFTNHRLDVEEGDQIYFFSDGLPDQFGGPNKMKFGPKRLRNKLLVNSHKTMLEQQQEIEDEFGEWMKEEKQIDDILIIGLKF